MSPRDLLTTIPGIGPLATAVLSAIGASVAEFFPYAAHLASWAGMCPGSHESAGKRHSGKRRHGNQHLQPVLVEAAWAAIRHEGCLKASPPPDPAPPGTSEPAITGRFAAARPAGDHSRISLTRFAPTAELTMKQPVRPIRDHYERAIHDPA